MYYSIKSFLQKIERMCYWGWKLRDNYDFDHGFVWRVMALKYRRLYNSMLNNSHLDWNRNADTTGMRKLLTMVVLCERIAKEDYTHKEADRMFDAYLERAKDRIFDERMTKAERDLFFRGQKHKDKLRAEDKKMFCSYLQKYGDTFWD